MSGLFGGGGATPEPKPIPTVQHTAVQAAGDVARKKARAARGRAATMLTSPATQLQAPSIGVTKLLGR